MLPHFSLPELLIIMVVILLLFGAKRIPEIAGSMGKGITEFKKHMNDAQDHITSGLNQPPPSSPRLTADDLQRRQASTEDHATPEPKRLI